MSEHLNTMYVASSSSFGLSCVLCLVCVHQFNEEFEFCQEGQEGCFLVSSIFAIFA